MIEKYYELAIDQTFKGLEQAEKDGFGELLSFFPNYMGINLCSVRGIFTQQQDDGQYTQIRIDFIPNNKE